MDLAVNSLSIRFPRIQLTRDFLWHIHHAVVHLSEIVPYDLNGKVVGIVTHGLAYRRLVNCLQYISITNWASHSFSIVWDEFSGAGELQGDIDEQVGDDLEKKLDSWRERLLDLGNRNPLVNCRFSDRSSLIEFDTPSSETIWRTLAAESEAGASVMRFPWRRDLVPPPADWKEFEDEPETDTSDNAPSTDSGGNDAGGEDSQPSVVFRRRKRREWNPSIQSCRESTRLNPSDLLVERNDATLDRKLRKLAGDAKLAMSEQGVQSLYAAFGFLKWYESVDSGEQRISPLMLVPVTLSRETTSAPWELTEAEDDALDNLCLRQRLRQDFKLELPPLPDISELEEPGAREVFLNSVRNAVSNNDRWTVEDRCAIGRFAFLKLRCGKTWATTASL